MTNNLPPNVIDTFLSYKQEKHHSFIRKNKSVLKVVISHKNVDSHALWRVFYFPLKEAVAGKRHVGTVLKFERLFYCHCTEQGNVLVMQYSGTFKPIV